jgi:hypothetical protein
VNRLILCEGATDAILLSYYLERTAGWKYSRKSPPNLDIRTADRTETVNWYRKEDDYLLISAVGGKDNFGRFFSGRIKAPLFAADAFSRIAVVTDRDRREIPEIEKYIGSALEGISVNVTNNSWVEGSYLDSYNLVRTVSVLLVVIPKEEQGALETVLLGAISEDAYDRNIVEAAGRFTEEMRVEAGRYITSDRLRMKAHLGVTWAVQYPEKVFSLIDEQIRSVRWEKSEILAGCFSKLVQI